MSSWLIGFGVSTSQAPAPSTLPSIDNNRDWLRQLQRFPVVVEFDLEQQEVLREQLCIGGQATVIAYTGDYAVLNQYPATGLLLVVLGSNRPSL